MTRCAWLLTLTLAAASGGCTADDLSPWGPDTGPLPTVPDRPFTPPPAGPVPTTAHAPATEAATRRVNDVGQRLLAANPGLPGPPVFLGVGSADPQIFHRDTTAIYVSDGLVNKCATEAQLAAVVASELGKMVSTRQAVLALKAARGERARPVGLAVGNDGGGTFGPADGTRLAELGKFEKDTGHGPSGRPAPPTDPDLLARTYLKKAGFAATDLDSVAPLLREAAQHDEIERQFTTGPIRPFVGP